VTSPSGKILRNTFLEATWSINWGMILIAKLLLALLAGAIIITAL